MAIDKTKTGLVGFVILLVAFGGNLYLTPDQLDNAFYCTSSEEIGIFYGGLSGTGLTAYPYSENRTDYVRCQKNGIKGVWLSLTDYAEEKGLDPLLIISQTKEITIENDVKTIVISYPNGRVYECTFQNEKTDNTIKSISQCNLKGG